MHRAILLALPLLLVSKLAYAANNAGHSALALAGVVAGYSTTLLAPDKAVMAALFHGNHPSYPIGQTISVIAAAVTCYAGDVSINAFSCTLKFGIHPKNLSGRKAHEIFATLIEAGVPGNGTAGKMYEAVLQLNCTIDPNEIKQNTGGGASCSFTPN